MDNILKEFEKYLDENYDADGEKNTIKAYYSDIKQFLNFFKVYYGEEIIDFTRAHITEYKQNFLNKEEYKLTTMNRKLASLSVYEDFLIDKGFRTKKEKIIKKFDFYEMERAYITSDMLPKKTIKKIKLKAAELSKRDYAMLVLLDNGGLRVSELISLQLDRDIDFDMYSVKILGKGKKVRTIFMEESIYTAIKDYLPDREKLLNGRENKYLFVSNKTANTNKPMNRTTVNKIIINYCNMVKENSIHPHIMRHDAATEKYEEGYTDIMLKKFLGHHSNITDVYAHPGGESYRRNNKNQGKM